MDQIQKNIVYGISVGLVFLILLILFFFFLSKIEIGLFTENKISVTSVSFDSINTSPSNKPTLTQTPLIPGVFSNGMQVRISGTGTDGLRIHSDAGLQTPTLFLGSEGDVYIIQSGPKLADNEIWWLIESQQNTTRSGWAAQKFLVSK